MSVRHQDFYHDHSVLVSISIIERGVFVLGVRRQSSYNDRALELLID